MSAQQERGSVANRQQTRALENLFSIGSGYRISEALNPIEMTPLIASNKGGKKLLSFKTPIAHIRER